MAISIQTDAGRRIPITSETATIGRDPACTIPFPDDSRVEPRHALLRRVADRWLVEGVSDQPLQIGDGRPARMHWLKPGDEIRLTASGPSFVFEPPLDTVHAAAAIASPQAIRGETSQPHLAAAAAPQTDVPAGMRNDSPPARTPGDIPRQSMAAPALWALTGAGLIVTGLVICLVLIQAIGSLPFKADLSTGDIAEHPGSTPAEPGAEIATREAAVEVAEPAAGEPVAAPVQAKPERMLFSVRVTDPREGQTFLLGTAWAASSTLLVTSGAVASAVEDLREILPEAKVLSPHLGKDFAVSGVRLHPEYRRLREEAKTAQEEAEAAGLELEQTQQQDAIRRLEEAITTAEERRLRAVERMVAYDVGLLEISGTLPEALEPARLQADPLAVGTRVVLAGVPFDSAEYLADPESPPLPATQTAVLFARRAAEGSSQGASRLIVKCKEARATDNWSGSPLLNRNGAVVGIYSRPTPSLTDASAELEPEAHDAAEIERLRELAPELFSD